jgi:hypothetical protein
VKLSFTAKWNFADNYVPKQELGNEINKITIMYLVHLLLTPSPN